MSDLRAAAGRAVGGGIRGSWLLFGGMFTGVVLTIGWLMAWELTTSAIASGPAHSTTNRSTFTQRISTVEVTGDWGDVTVIGRRESAAGGPSPAASSQLPASPQPSAQPSIPASPHPPAQPSIPAQPQPSAQLSLPAQPQPSAGSEGSDIVVERRSDWLALEPTVRESVTGETLRIESACPRSVNPLARQCSVTFELRLPSTVAVKVSAQRGTVKASGFTADVTVDTAEGDIVVSQLTGRFSATSDFGSITGTDLTCANTVADSHSGSLDLAFREAPALVRARSDFGNVDVAVPKAPGGYRTNLTNHMGGATVDITNSPSATREIVAESNSGEIHLRYIG